MHTECARVCTLQIGRTSNIGRSAYACFQRTIRPVRVWYCATLTQRGAPSTLRIAQKSKSP